MEWRKSGPQLVHQRHMPMEPKKFHIPRKTKEKKALFQFVSTESREYEDMKTILTSGYIDTNSAGCFSYSNPRLVHSELLEKEVRNDFTVSFYFTRSIQINSLVYFHQHRKQGLV
ncbi:hypothetical protein ATANTOWER_019272 [Ataeniobius toweri]|uniref:Uncharacterized protein n=1 Tax=Ataeniobius toweri TaxID=208326 RepID=A0ABU7CKQ1_9TELE|nr:hypothetical protein [Ataeniobius toweri]